MCAFLHIVGGAELPSKCCHMNQLVPLGTVRSLANYIEHVLVTKRSSAPRFLEVRARPAPGLCWAKTLRTGGGLSQLYLLDVLGFHNDVASTLWLGRSSAVPSTPSLESLADLVAPAPPLIRSNPVHTFHRI